VRMDIYGIQVIKLTLKKVDIKIFFLCEGSANPADFFFPKVVFYAVNVYFKK